jgi:ribosomal protein S18 acetylase RimI-like enzyme
MPRIHDLSLEDPEGEDSQHALHEIDKGLTEYNHSQAPDPDAGPLLLVMRNEAEEIIGGVRGRTAYGWLRIDILWVAAPSRGQGYGTMLLSAAERAAGRRNCHSVHLDTHEFQAPNFYRAHGYEVFGELEDYPTGQRHYYFKKRIAIDASR